MRNITRLRKIHNVVEYLESKYQEYYVPYSNVSVDESTIGFKGKIAFKTYNLKKPTKWGLRMFVLSDSTNGYINSMLPYYGRYTRELLNNVSNLSYTANIVIHLCRSLQKLGPSSGHHIFTDRFYSSIPCLPHFYKWICITLEHCYLIGKVTHQR